MPSLMEQREAAFENAKSLAEKVKSGEASVAEAEAALAEVDSIDAKIAEAKKGSAILERLGQLKSGEGEQIIVKSGEAKTLGEHFVKNAGDRLRQVKGISGASVAVPEFVKAATDPVVTGGASGALGPLLTQVDRNLVTGYRRPTVTSLFGQGTLTGSAITYFVEGAKTGDFTTVAESGAKPQLNYANPTPVTEALSKIAGFIKVSDEMIEDLDFLVSEINGRLLYDLSLVEEAQVLSGDGTSPNLTGLLNRSGIQTETVSAAGDEADALFRAITKVSTATGLTADGILISPADYQKLRLSKDSNGQYFGGGFFSGQYGQGGVQEQPPLWGLRTVVSPAVSVGTAVVGAFTQGATVYRKGGVRVESTNSHASDFTSNLVTIRAEERLALAVRKPSAFVKVTLTAGA